MIDMENRLLLKTQLSDCSVSILHHTVVLLLLTHSCGGQSQVISPPQPIVAMVGDDIILPCHLEPAVDAVDLTVEWARPDLDPRFVHLRRDRVDLLNERHPSYMSRTSLSTTKMKCGDISLKLSTVKLSDAGMYNCLVPKSGAESVVELVVGSVSSPDIEISIVSNRVMLDCKSQGWYPEPEVLWLDGEGKLLPAGPTETVRGPDGLYTVSSRVTVEKRHSNSFTCRVQQKIINQTRETQFEISGFTITAEQPMVPSSAARISLILAAVFIFILAVVFVVWKWQNNMNMRHPEDGPEQTGQTEQLMATSKNTEYSEEKKTNVDEELQKREEEQKVFVLVVDTLKEQKEELEKLRGQLRSHVSEMEREAEQTEEQFQLVHKETEGDRAKGYWRLKEILLNNKIKLQERKQGQEELILTTDTLVSKVIGVLKETEKEGENMEKTTVTGGS